MSQKKTPATKDEFVDYRIGEAEEKIESLKTEVTAGFEKINKKLDETFATKDYVDEKLKPLVEKILSLEDDKKWMTRLIGGAIMIAVLGTVLVTKG